MSYSFLVVGSPRAPRWLLPETDINLDLVLRNWRPYRWYSRVMWWGTRAMLRHLKVRGTSALKHAGLNWMAEFDWRSFGWSRRSQPLPLIYLGSPGPSRKAVVHLVDPLSGACELIVKVPLTGAAEWWIVHEANVLRTLQTEGVAAPRTVHLDAARGIASQTAIPGCSGGRQFSQPLLRLFQSLQVNGAGVSLAASAATLDQRLRSTSLNGPVSELLSRAIAHMADERPLPAFWVHGDFTPWNIRQQIDGTALLIDWEMAQPNGLPLHDAFHFIHVQRHLFGKRPRAYYQQVQHVASQLGVPPELCLRLELAYLVDRRLACKSRRDAAKTRYLDSVLAQLTQSYRPSLYRGVSPETA